LNIFKRIWRNPEHRIVITNTFSLSGLQVANALLPLVAVPYVVWVIGPANYGAVAFAQAFATYFVLLVNYGFDLSASRGIARVRDDAEKLSDVSRKCHLMRPGSRQIRYEGRSLIGERRIEKERDLDRQTEQQ